MRLLLDTHALLWWLDDDSRLGTDFLATIAAPENDVLVSMASLWEIAIKVRIGKLVADVDAIVAEIALNRFRPLGIEPSHLRALLDLPTHHRDPFDHLLIAQSFAERAVLVSDDRRIGQYPVSVMTCGTA